MDSSFYLFLFFLSFFSHAIILANSSSSKHPLCHDDERSALIQFKNSFVISNIASSDPSAYPKVESWKLQRPGVSTDCCLWDGVECDPNTGYVTGLDLSSSFLYGSLNSTSTLFKLLHLQRLNLADNNFNYSNIPSEIGYLSRLTALNLSNSLFSGEIPLDISNLSRLVLLDLSYNVDESSFQGLLTLGNSGMQSLLYNLTNLEVLYLSQVLIASQVPEAFANLSSLTTLVLRDCNLHGAFPVSIFHLPKLQVLSVRFNPNLTGYLPEFHTGAPLGVLKLASTSFSGKLPESIENLNLLNTLDLSNCGFSGALAVSLGNLSRLTYLDLKYNNFSGDIPSLDALSNLQFLSLSYNEFNSGVLPRLDKLTKLSEVYLRQISLHGFIPLSIGNLTQLTGFGLSFNRLSGEIPPAIGNLTDLIGLDAINNRLQGPIPKSFSQLKKLQLLDLTANDLSGNIELGIFLNLKHLTKLILSTNKLNLRTRNTSNSTLPQFQILGLGSCNLVSFPDFLRYQDNLQQIYLQRNQIGGLIPGWMLNTSKETLEELSIDNNFLTGFEQHPDILPWANLAYLDLSSNKLSGKLPIPPLSTVIYSASQNMLKGEIPPTICQLRYLRSLDLSNNNLTGAIPPCLSNFSNSLSILNVKSNKLRGPIPWTYVQGNKLKVIDFSHNQLEGNVRRSMANCTLLEILDLSSNLIQDTFPFWLGALKELKVLFMGSNRFYGGIQNGRREPDFPNLCIIDLSSNGFSGILPTRYFQNWNAMKSFDTTRGDYMQTMIDFQWKDRTWSKRYLYTMTITNKGVITKYEKILTIFFAIDFSNNRFVGEIPEEIGSLKGLQLLNLSNDGFNSKIPSSLGKLTELESLDISRNSLSGEIPGELARLTFLSFLNVSNNHLSGEIPRGRQFATFQDNSYGENPGLCGEPLSKRCGKSVPPTKSPQLDSSQGGVSMFLGEVGWIVISMGYASGIVVGVVTGLALTSRHHEWLIETFGRKQQKRCLWGIR